MVIPSIDHGDSVPDTALVGSIEHIKALQQPLPVYIFLHMIAMQAAKYLYSAKHLYFSSLGKSVP